MSEISAAERIIMSIDTSDLARAETLAGVARDAGARYVKMGLELSSAEGGWRDCADLAAAYGLGWVADAKIDDIPATSAAAVRNISRLEHPPLGITMHTTAGFEALQMAQETAGAVKILGVTVLTSISDTEAQELFGAPVEHKVMSLARMAAAAGVQGIVASPREVGSIKRYPSTGHLFAMIPGTRSATASHNDQARVSTPGEAIKDGADLLVIGRQITAAPTPDGAYRELIAEIETALRTKTD